MTGALHLLAGSTIYTLLGFSKPLTAILALGSHFLLDAIPHQDGFIINAVLGIPAVVFLFYTARRRKDRGLLWAAFLGIFPDINHFFNVAPAMVKLHRSCHFFPLNRVPAYELYLEITCCIICGILILAGKPSIRRP